MVFRFLLVLWSLGLFCNDRAELAARFFLHDYVVLILFVGLHDKYKGHAQRRTYMSMHAWIYV